MAPASDVVFIVTITDAFTITLAAPIHCIFAGDELRSKFIGYQYN